jgi:hypothetical protein
MYGMHMARYAKLGTDVKEEGMCRYFLCVWSVCVFVYVLVCMACVWPDMRNLALM